jgi:hypothetical protein
VIDTIYTSKARQEKAAKIRFEQYKYEQQQQKKEKVLDGLFVMLQELTDRFNNVKAPRSRLVLKKRMTHVQRAIEFVSDYELPKLIYFFIFEGKYWGVWKGNTRILKVLLGKRDDQVYSVFREVGVPVRGVEEYS